MPCSCFGCKYYMSDLRWKSENPAPTPLWRSLHEMLPDISFSSSRLGTVQEIVVFIRNVSSSSTNSSRSSRRHESALSSKDGTRICQARKFFLCLFVFEFVEYLVPSVQALFTLRVLTFPIIIIRSFHFTAANWGILWCFPIRKILK